MASLLKGVREYLTPLRVTSGFLEKGVLTPEEFVTAGDQLVFKCPTWSWESGDPAKAKPYLPADKQFLVTHNVPCHRRAINLESDYVGDTEVEGDGQGGVSEGWIEPNVLTEAHHAGASGAASTVLELKRADGGSDFVLPDLGDVGDDAAELTRGFGAVELRDDHFQASAMAAAVASGTAGLAPDEGDDFREAPHRDEYLDLDSFVQDNVVEPDQATLHTAAYVTAEEPDDTIVRTRSYDLGITYDKYYQTPRMWLYGYDESQQALSGEQMFEDVMQDYVKQTVTIELHPHLDSYHASVHPCRHAAVMKRIVDNLRGGGMEARVDQYLFIFLKFIQSVVPTVNYDYTMDVTATV